MPDCDVYVRHSFEGALEALPQRSHRALSLPTWTGWTKGRARTLSSRRRTTRRTAARKAAEICQDATRPPAERYNLLREISSRFVRSRLSQRRCRASRRVRRGTGASSWPTCSRDNDVVLTELFSLMDHDDGTYSHCVNVATYTMLLAKYLGVAVRRHLCTSPPGDCCTISANGTST